ncbi:hypothetical protein IAT38_003094 [Cryptococcus sp. DSM 104549]
MSSYNNNATATSSRDTSSLGDKLSSAQPISIMPPGGSIPYGIATGEGTMYSKRMRMTYRDNDPLFHHRFETSEGGITGIPSEIDICSIEPAFTIAAGSTHISKLQDALPSTPTHELEHGVHLRRAPTKSDYGAAAQWPIGFDPHWQSKRHTILQGYLLFPREDKPQPPWTVISGFEAPRRTLRMLSEVMSVQGHGEDFSLPSHLLSVSPHKEGLPKINVQTDMTFFHPSPECGGYDANEVEVVGVSALEFHRGAKRDGDGMYTWEGDVSWCERHFRQGGQYSEEAVESDGSR